MRIEKTDCNYQVTECDLKFGEQITLDGELLTPVSSLDKIRADYENRLKADMMAMLTDIQLEIEELKKEPACCHHFVRGIRKSSEVIQQKIDALKMN